MSAVPDTLVVRAPNWVGDLVMATPVLEAALTAPGFDRVAIALRGHLADVLRDGPLEPHLVPLARRGDESAALARLRPRAALLLSSSFGAAWRAFRARVPIRAGAAIGARRHLLTHAVVPPTRDGRRVPIATAHLQRDVAGLVGVLPRDLHPRLSVGAASRSDAARRLEEAGLEPGAPYALCCPGAAFGAAKLWPPEHFAAALDGLFERRGLRSVVTGGPGEQALVRAVAAGTRTGAVALADAAGGLATLKALVADARLLLVGDSGPRWYAAAFDVPCVSVMGPNFPELTASSLERCTIVRREGLECAPCLRRACPLEHHRCMREIEPERVVAAAEALLA